MSSPAVGRSEFPRDRDNPNRDNPIGAVMLYPLTIQSVAADYADEARQHASRARRVREARAQARQARESRKARRHTAPVITLPAA
jgi:hypothetical protein